MEGDKYSSVWEVEHHTCSVCQLCTREYDCCKVEKPALHKRGRVNARLGNASNLSPEALALTRAPALHFWSRGKSGRERYHSVEMIEECISIIVTSCGRPVLGGSLSPDGTPQILPGWRRRGSHQSLWKSRFSLCWAETVVCEGS